jgi:hypothetical protein
LRRSRWQESDTSNASCLSIHPTRDERRPAATSGPWTTARTRTDAETDDLRSYRAATLDLGIDHLHDRGRCKNNRAENSHQPTRRRERKMQRFKSAGSAQKAAPLDRTTHIALRRMKRCLLTASPAAVYAGGGRSLSNGKPVLLRQVQSEFPNPGYPLGDGKPSVLDREMPCARERS